MVPATVQDQTNAINVCERDPTAGSPKLPSESNRVAPTVLAIDSDNSVLEHASPGVRPRPYTRELTAPSGHRRAAGVLSTDLPAAPDQR